MRRNPHKRWQIKSLFYIAVLVQPGWKVKLDLCVPAKVGECCSCSSDLPGACFTSNGKKIHIKSLKTSRKGGQIEKFRTVLHNFHFSLLFHPSGGNPLFAVVEMWIWRGCGRYFPRILLQTSPVLHHPPEFIPLDVLFLSFSVKNTENLVTSHSPKQFPMGYISQAMPEFKSEFLQPKQDTETFPCWAACRKNTAQGTLIKSCAPKPLFLYLTRASSCH